MTLKIKNDVKMLSLFDYHTLETENLVITRRENIKIIHYYTCPL